MICQALNFDDKLLPLGDPWSIGAANGLCEPSVETGGVVNAGTAGVQTGVRI